MPVRVRAAPRRFLRGSITDLTRGKRVPQLAQVAYVLRKLITHRRFMSCLMVMTESATRAATAVPLPVCREFESLHARQCHCCTSCTSVCCRRRFSYQLLATLQARCAQHVADDVCKLAQQCFKTKALYLVLLPSSATLTDRVAWPKAQQCRRLCFACRPAGPGASPTMLYSLR